VVVEQQQEQNRTTATAKQSNDTSTSKSSRYKVKGRAGVTLTGPDMKGQDRAQEKATTHRRTSTLYMNERYVKVAVNKREELNHSNERDDLEGQRP